MAELSTSAQDDSPGPDSHAFRKSVEDRIASLEKSMSDHVTANQSLESSLRTAMVMLASIKLSGTGRQLEGKVDKLVSKMDQVVSRLEQLEALAVGEKKSDKPAAGESSILTTAKLRSPGGATTRKVSGPSEVRRSTLLRHAENSDTDIQVTDQETELRQNAENCPHSDRHTFLDIEHFSMNDLPESFRADRMLEHCIVRGLAQLSGRVKVKAVSMKRPLTFPESSAPYPFAWCKGEPMTRLGSGKVYFVNLNESDCTTFCKGNGSRSHGCWKINVRTTTRLVFDQSEADHCEIELTFGGREWVLTGGTWRDMNDGGNSCEVDFVSHDRELGEGLMALLEGTDQALEEVNKSHERKDVEEGLVLMVSHPHGTVRAKVSLGTVKRREVKKVNECKYFRLCFTAPSCVGSVGGSVWPVGCRDPRGHFVNYGLPYSGRNDQGEMVTGWQ